MHLIRSKIPIVFLLIFMISFYCISKYSYDFLKTKQEEQRIFAFFHQKVKNELHIPDYMEEKNNKVDKENFIGVLEIPSIKLKKGFYSLGSEKNTVNVGLEVIQDSVMPNQENGPLVIAAHSGTGYLAFFNKLDQVKKNDFVYIYYNGLKYIYEVEQTLIEKKTGQITVEFEEGQHKLVLTTCNPSNPEKEQFTLISNLKRKENFNEK